MFLGVFLRCCTLEFLIKINHFAVIINATYIFRKINQGCLFACHEIHQIAMIIKIKLSLRKIYAALINTTKWLILIENSKVQHLRNTPKNTFGLASSQ